ncbi:MAG: MATE family efflux transporter, partial [Eubacterium sp.]|nr:MATE family efflux transporter [Eubacterium sp.]
MKDESLIKDLTEGNVAKELIVYSLPFMGASILQVLYNLVDLAVVGHFVGSVGLSAVGIGGHLLMLITSFIIGFSAGGQIYISQLVGSKNYDKLNKTIGTLFVLLLGTGVLITIIGLIVSPHLIGILHTPEAAVSQTGDYMLICCGGVLFICGYNVVSAILRGMGESRLPMVFALVATAVNVVLDLVFVGAMGMQSAGAALATIIGQGVSFLISIVYLYIHRKSFGFDFKLSSFIPNRVVMGRIVRLGLPIGIQQIFIQVSMMFVNSRVNACSLTASAVDAVGAKLNGIMGVITASMQSASSAMIGQNIAAGKKDRVRKIFWTNEAVCTGFLVVIAILCLGFPTQVFSLFNSEEE